MGLCCLAADGMVFYVRIISRTYKEIMKQKKNQSIEIQLSSGGFEEARGFIEERLNADKVSKEIISETMLIFEALFHDILERGSEFSSELKITCQNSFGEIKIKLGFEGAMFFLAEDNRNVNDPEKQILIAYKDKIDTYYHSGYNNIQLTVRRRYVHSLFFCIAGMILAGIVFLPIHFLMTREGQTQLVQSYLTPLETAFGNAALMIGAPVTFFSLLKHITDTYILSQRYSDVRKLQIKTIATSIIVILAACCTGFLLFGSFGLQNMLGQAFNRPSASETFSELITSAVPTSIFAPFEAISPIPLLVLAIILAYAFCASGKYFGVLNKGVDICYTVFSKMLSLVMFTLPFFCFLNFLDALLTDVSLFAESLISIVILILVSMIVLFVYYLLRLLIGKVKPGPFLKKLQPLLLENFRINSVIEAVPFNIRYCVKNYGMNRKQLEKQLPVLAEINLDGNAFVLMLFAMYLLAILRTGYPWYLIVVVSVIVLFLSLGAPNQPGSILIGILIIMQFLGIKSGMATLAIFIEVFFGIFQNMINVTGSIVTVAIDDRKTNPA